MVTPNNYTSSDVWTETGDLLGLTPSFVDKKVAYLKGLISFFVSCAKTFHTFRRWFPVKDHVQQQPQQRNDISP